ETFGYSASQTGRRMINGRKWAAVPGLAVIAVAATLLSAYSGAQAAQQASAQPASQVDSRDPAVIKAAMDTVAERGPWAYSAASSDVGYSPEQPIAFPHPVHVQGAGMNC